MVPHVPDECYTGAGKVRLRGETVRLEIPRNDLDDPTQKIGLQYVVFGQTGDNIMQNDVTFSVQYLFYVNGKLYRRPDTKRAWPSGVTGPVSTRIFSKVEWTFSGVDAFGRVYPDKEQTLEASKKLLASLLPEPGKKPLARLAEN